MKLIVSSCSALVSAYKIMARPSKSRASKIEEAQQEGSYFEKLESETKSNQSRISLVLGGLIVLVVGILVFNFLNRPAPQLGPAQETPQEGDVSPENLPGKYTVKEGDTLFLIAEKYYSDGFKYPEIAEANDLTNTDVIEVGQVLEIPKLEDSITEVFPASDASPRKEQIKPENIVPPGEKGADLGTGTGGGDTTIWGPKIEGDSYTVKEGDWLSTISARAYGDIMAYTKLAEANNIQDPNLILPGQVLKIPR